MPTARCGTTTRFSPSSYVNPGKAGHGRFYQQAATDDFPGMMQILKNYVQSRGQFIDTSILTDENQIPQKPTINYTGAASHPGRRADVHQQRVHQRQQHV